LGVTALNLGRRSRCRLVPTGPPVRFRVWSAGSSYLRSA